MIRSAADEAVRKRRLAAIWARANEIGLIGVEEEAPEALAVTPRPVGWVWAEPFQPEAEAIRAEISARIKTVLGTLRPYEADVLTKRFGIGCEPLTLEEIATGYDVTRERIRQIESKALRKLRHPARARLLRECTEGVDRAAAPVVTLPPDLFEPPADPPGHGKRRRKTSPAIHAREQTGPPVGWWGPRYCILTTRERAGGMWEWSAADDIGTDLCAPAGPYWSDAEARAAAEEWARRARIRFNGWTTPPARAA